MMKSHFMTWPWALKENRVMIVAIVVIIAIAIKQKNGIKQQVCVIVYILRSWKNVPILRLIGNMLILN